MLHTKFRENQSTGSGEDLGHVTWTIYTRRLHIKFGFDWPSGFGEDI